MNPVFKDLLRKGLIYGLGSSLNGLAGFFLIPFLLHRLSAEEYGRFALAEAWLNILLVLASMGLNTSMITQYFNIQEERRPVLFRSALAAVGFSSLGIVLVLSLAFGALAQFGIQPIPLRLWGWVALIIPLETLWMQFASLFRAEETPLRLVSLSMLQVVISCGSTVLLIVYAGRREESLLMARAGADAVILAAVCLRERRLFGALDWSLARRAVEVGLPLVPATLSTVWLVMAPRVLLGFFSTDFEVGVYAMSARIAGIISLLLVQPLGIMWIPAAFRIKQRPDAKRIFDRALSAYVLIAGSLVALIGLLAPLASDWFATSRFPVPPDIVALVALALASSGIIYLVTLGPFFEQKTALSLPPYLIVSALSFVMGVPLISMWGALGAAVSAILSYSILWILAYRVSRRLYPISYSWNTLLKIAGLLGGAYFAAQAVDRLAGSRNFDLAVFACIMAGSYLFLRLFHGNDAPASDA
jgi:O-antigen/teichoic acid export membrane protein